MTCDAATLVRLDELLAAIAGYPDPRRAADEWKQLFRLLAKTSLPQARVTHTVGMRDVKQAAELIDLLRTPPETAQSPSGAAFDPEELKRALRAFRRRAGLTRLDEESHINSHSPLSKGADAGISAAIVPPDEWPAAIWEELARQGKLRYVGHGFYEWVKP